MKIDINREPPADIFRNRGKYARIFITLLILVLCGMLLTAYIIFSNKPYNENLESIALAFYFVSAIAIFYFGEKLQAYKKLTPPQEKELADLCNKHMEIDTYCRLVAKAGRKPIHAEFEAFQNWAEEVSRNLNSTDS